MVARSTDLEPGNIERVEEILRDCEVYLETDGSRDKSLVLVAQG